MLLWDVADTGMSFSSMNLCKDQRIVAAINRRATLGNVGMDSSKKPPEMKIFCRKDGTSQRVKQTTLW